MTYAAPVKDIRFALDEIVAVDGLKTTGAFEDLSGDLLDAVLDGAAKLTGEVLAPLNAPADKAGAVLDNGVVRTAPGFKDAYRQYVEGGWQGLSAPAAIGGAGLPRAIAVAVGEMVNSANMAFGLGPMLTLGAIEAIAQHGSDDQKALYLPKLITGEWSGSMNLTEPNAGSDVGLLKTRAEPAGDGSFRLFGQKIWITWGEHDCAENVVHLVLARLPGAPAGTRGISLFIAPKFIPNADGSPGERNDLKCIGLEHKLGVHASPTCVMSYGDDGGAKAWLIGQENAGMRAMFTMMNAARLHVGAQGVAIAERAYQRALAFAKDRRQGRSLAGEQPAPIIEHPDVRRMLISMKAKIAAGRAICLATAVAADHAEHAEDEADRAAAKAREDILTPIAKAWCTDMGVEATSLGVQVHGGMGFVEEAGAAQHYRDARITPIYEGTNGIQAIDLVGRKIEGDGGRALAALLADIRQTAEDLALSSNVDLPPIGRRLNDAADALTDAGDWLLDADTSPADRLAGATAFLQLAGDVCGGWLLGKGAIAGQRRLKEDAPDPAYAQAQIDLAAAYADLVLSGVPGRRDAIRIGADRVFALAPDQL